MNIPVVGLGAGGHAKVVIEILRAVEGFELIGLLDARQVEGARDVLGVPIIGDDGRLAELVEKGIKHFFVGVGSAKDVSLRRRLYEAGLAHGLQPVSAIHPQATISPSARIGMGVTVMAGALINASSVLGVNVVVNTGAIIEHDCVIGNHAYISSGACLAAAVRLGDGVHIGNGASVRQCLQIGAGVVVGTGAAVVGDIREGITVVGVPAREIGRGGESCEN